MSVSTTIDSAKGVVSTNNASGITLEVNSANSGFRPYAAPLVRAITSLITLSAGDAGNMTVTGGSPVTIVMPDAANCIGAEFTIRSLSAQAHVISGSTTMFACSSSVGAQITLAASIGSSVSLKSDGLVFLVLGYRNTLVYA
jgi:hypothetical protein